MLDTLRKYGADVEGALKRFVQDEDLFKTCIHMFLEDQNFIALGKACAEQDYQEAFQCAHTLKGVAANLGLSPLYSRLDLLVEDLRNKKYRNIEAEYRMVMQEKTIFEDLVKKASS